MRGIILIGLCACLIMAIFGFLAVYISYYSLDVIDMINLRQEEKNRVPEVDRVIYVKALVDQEYINITAKEKKYGVFWDESIYFVRDWDAEKYVKRVIQRASKSFEHQFGIEFVLVEIETWNPESWNSYGLFREMKKEVPLNDYDMVIAFTGRATDLTSLGEFPFENTLGNYVLFSLHVPKEAKKASYFFNSYHLQSYVLVHELGHNFGAVHPEEIHAPPNFPKMQSLSEYQKLVPFFRKMTDYFKKTFSVMNAGTAYFTTHFDEYNKEIVFGNKYLPTK